MAKRPRGKAWVRESLLSVLSWVITWLLTSGLAPKNSASQGDLPRPQPPPIPWLSYEATARTRPASFPGEASQGGASNTHGHELRLADSPRLSMTAPWRLPCEPVDPSRPGPSWSSPTGIPAARGLTPSPEHTHVRPARFSRPSSPDSACSACLFVGEGHHVLSPCPALNPSHCPSISPCHLISHAGSVVTLTPHTANPQGLRSLQSTFC